MLLNFKDEKIFNMRIRLIYFFLFYACDLTSGDKREAAKTLLIGLSFLDVMIIQSGSKADCNIVYSEVLSHDMVYQEIKVVVPFS